MFRSISAPRASPALLTVRDCSIMPGTGGLSHCRRDMQFVVNEFAAKAANAVDLLHDHPCVNDHLATCRRDSGETFPVAYKELHPKLLLEQLELLAHARLRGIKLVRRSRDVQSVIDDREQVS